MGKSGRGILMIATDVAAENEAEVNDWYDREHLPERVGIAGFLCARRYRAVSAERTYLALYETQTIDVLDSPDYRHRLANQTERSKRALAQFLRPHRAIARITASRGSEVGGAISMTLIPGSTAAGGATRDRIVAKLLPDLIALPGIVATHLFECDPRLSQPLPETGPSAVQLAAPDDWLLVTEGSDTASLQTASRAWQTAALPGIGSRSLGTYLLMSSLSRDDL